MLEIEIEPTVPVYLTTKQVKQWIMMEFLNSTGALDVKLGRVTIDFDDKGQIGNLKIEKNYKPK